MEKKVFDRKWNGNRVEMERIWNGKKERAIILANGFGNGKGIDGILLLFAWNFQMDKNGKVMTFWSLPYDSIPFNSIPFHGTSTFH